MPILGSEPDIYPLDLLTMEDRQRKWSVFSTAPRQEKVLMRRLYSQQIPFYGIVVPTRKRTFEGRSRTSYLPLFPGYLFFFGIEEERIKALKSNLVVTTLKVPQPEQLVKDLLRIRLLIETGQPVTREEQLVVGQRVRVKSGKLEGQEGTIIQRRGTDLLVVSINFLQQGASVLLGDFQVESA